MTRTDITYGRLGEVLQSLGFVCRKKAGPPPALRYEHEQTGALVSVPPYPDTDFVLPHHLLGARLFVTLERVMQEHARTVGNFDFAATARRLGDAFRDFGLDPTREPPEAIGTAIATSQVRNALLGYLQEWEGQLSRQPDRARVGAAV